MKVCLVCGESSLNNHWQCPKCLHQPQSVEGHLVFAPELALDNDGFEGDYFEQLAQIEEKHFWFRSRSRLITWSLQRYFPLAESFLDIGCGTGYVLSSIQRKFPDLKLSGSDIYFRGLHFASGRIDNIDLYQMDARRMPFKEEFDVIGAFDVLEHIHEDSQVLSQMHQALRQGGGVILTVPQHRFLWSSWDALSCHKRRYTRKHLGEKMEEAGFHVVGYTSFFSFLLPLIMVSRLKKSQSGGGGGPGLDISGEFDIPSYINKSMEKICDWERKLPRCGVSLPAGGSLLMVGVKT